MSKIREAIEPMNRRFPVLADALSETDTRLSRLEALQQEGEKPGSSSADHIREFMDHGSVHFVGRENAQPDEITSAEHGEGGALILSNRNAEDMAIPPDLFRTIRGLLAVLSTDEGGDRTARTNDSGSHRPENATEPPGDVSPGGLLEGVEDAIEGALERNEPASPAAVLAVADWLDGHSYDPLAVDALRSTIQGEG